MAVRIEIMSSKGKVLDTFLLEDADFAILEGEAETLGLPVEDLLVKIVTEAADSVSKVTKD